MEPFFSSTLLAKRRTLKGWHTEYDAALDRASTYTKADLVKQQMGLCVQAMLTYHAYRKVGIRYVPAIILGRPKRMLDESGICLRAGNERAQFDGTIALARKKVATIIGSNATLEKLGPLKALNRLQSEVARAAHCIKAFHIKSDLDIIHYHHCLYSVAYRLFEALKAIELLLRSGLEYQIRPIIRSTYELFLNFYLDWLSPEHVGLAMQGVALLARTGSDDPSYNELEESMKHAFGGFINVCRNAAEKGRLSPLGAELHEQIYSILSPAVHQDFGVTHEYGSALEDGRPEKMGRREILENIRWLDIVSAATISRLMDDVGAPILGHKQSE